MKRTSDNLPWYSTGDSFRTGKLGIRVLGLTALRTLVEKRCSIVVPSSRWKPIPAAVAINMSGTTLLNAFNRGMFLYCPKSKSKKVE